MPVRIRKQQQPASKVRGSLKACRNFRFMLACLIVIWFIYVIGVIVTTVGVHKLDSSVSSEHLRSFKNSTSSGGGGDKAQQQQSEKVSPHHVVANAMVQQQQQQQQQQQSKGQEDNASLKKRRPEINQSPTKALNITIRKGPEAKVWTPPALLNKLKDGDKPKTRMKRPGFKPKPFGHMVNPDLLLSHKDEEEEYISANDPNREVPEDQILAAYLEPIDQSTWETTPLPVRTTTAKDLEKRPYTKLNSCSRLPEQWPVDEYPDEDPFLPWIHDVFPTFDGKYIQFVAQNKRRCHTGTTEEEEALLVHTAPQVALFEHVPLKKLDTSTPSTPRYRLSSHEDADPESLATRFICRFKPSGDITFSEFNNDYEWVAFRKGQNHMFSEDGRDQHQIQTSQLLFRCPVPDHLVETVKNGDSVKDDWATLFLDSIPVRTPPRIGYPEEFLVPRYQDEVAKKRFRGDPFDPHKAWGENHVIPTFEDSGRWENIPICQPSLKTYEPQALERPGGWNGTNHHLVSCLWASAGYATRGNRYAINDGQRRLVEWITFNKMLGFDHFYIYDNSGAFSDDFSLRPILDVFPGEVTIVNWPSQVCNNNPNNVDSPGERSSQYAAESSCRLRFGPHVKWIGQFDIDEYLVPMGESTSVLPLLEKLDEEDTKIISFASWRAWPRRSYINEPIPIIDKELCGHREACFELSIPNNTTLLEAYNCDRQKPGQKKKQMPAEKQIYRADYVKQHFIHYSTVTETTNLLLADYQQKFKNARPFPDPKSRFVDEVKEGLMLHSKAIARQDTAGYVRNCHSNFSGFDQCRIGYPWPKGSDEVVKIDEDGWEYNCYAHEKIDDYWGPRLKNKLKEMGFL